MAKGKKQAGPSKKKAGSPKPKRPVVSLGQRTRSGVRGGRGRR